MENGFKYQDSLDLFEEIYYTESGELKKEDWRDRSFNSNTYRNIRVVNSGRSKIVGKSAFTPRIVRKPFSGKWGKGDNGYFLTIDNEGKFSGEYYPLFYDNNMGNINEIDITDMSKEEVLNEVKQMLTMSNEEIMKKSNIRNIPNVQIKLELIIDDIIQEYLIQNDMEIEDASYSPDNGINIFIKDGGNINQRHRRIDDGSDILIGVGQIYDRISYKVLSGSGASEYEDIRVEIKEELTHIESELGKKILDTLRDRFTEKKAEKDEVEQPVQEDSEVVSEYNGEYDACSIDRLQNILKETEDSNRNKKIKIKELEEKNKLIKQILEAKAKGKELDTRISELNNEFTTPEQ